jgi:hypothetical protein
MRHGLSRLARAKSHAKSDSAASYIFSLQECHPEVPVSFWARSGLGVILRGEWSRSLSVNAIEIFRKVWELHGSDNRENRDHEFSEDRAAKFVGSD